MQSYDDIGFNLNLRSINTRTLLEAVRIPNAINDVSGLFMQKPPDN